MVFDQRAVPTSIYNGNQSEVVTDQLNWRLDSPGNRK